MTSDRRETVIRVTMTTESLAAELHAAERAVLKAKASLEELLDSLFSGYSTYDCHDGVLDVFGALSSDAALDALRRAGFHSTWIHHHGEDEFRACNCRAR